MSMTLDQIKILVVKGAICISDHGYDELAADNLFARDVVAGVPAAELVEDYPDFPKGPCVLVLQPDPDGRPIHVVWGIPKGEATPAVLVTAYRPAAERWSSDFRRRKK
jgi:hypothetical protein